MTNFIQFNTGRFYSPEGQIIKAMEHTQDDVKGILFSDTTRQIMGFLPECALNQDEIMNGYDSIRYVPCDDPMALRALEKMDTEEDDNRPSM